MKLASLSYSKFRYHVKIIKSSLSYSNNIRYCSNGVEKKTNYQTHIPLSPFQRALLSAGSATMAITDPRRDDMVAVFGETTGKMALQKMHSKMINDPEGSRILQDKPRINSKFVDLEYLKTLPEGTLGHAYINFLTSNKVTPDSRLDVQFINEPHLAYVMQRYREIHDLYHTVLGMPTNMIGEVSVKWVEALQTGLPMCALAAVFGPLRFKQKQRRKYLEHYLPWAIKCGLNSQFIMNVYFEKCWEEDITDLRKSLNIQVLCIEN